MKPLLLFATDMEAAAVRSLCNDVQTAVCGVGAVDGVYLVSVPAVRRRFLCRERPCGALADGAHWVGELPRLDTLCGAQGGPFHRVCPAGYAVVRHVTHLRSPPSVAVGYGHGCGG